MDPIVISWSLHLFSLWFWWKMFQVWTINNTYGEELDGMQAMLPASLVITGMLTTFYTLASFGKTLLENYSAYNPFA